MAGTRPTDLDLLAFFGVEPTLVDAEAPWIYNTATYTAERNGYSVKFEISPSYSTLKVSLAKAEHELAAAEVTSFTGLEIKTDGGRVTLVARFGESAASALHLTLEPRVRLSFVASSDS